MISRESHQSAHAKEPSETTIKLSVQKIKNMRNKKLVQIKLTKIKDNQPVTLNHLKKVHTEKIHLLIIDDSLQDYRHIHPTATKIPGVYGFTWQPKKEGNYRIWADLLPLDTHTQEYAVSDLTLAKNSKATIDRTVSLKSIMDGLTFKLSFDRNLQVDKATMGKIDITNQQGTAVKDLEPIMGSFAHIVGFSDDFRSVVHIHPMGKEPSQVTDRGGPELRFHIEPKKSGFIKLFAQVKIKGKELFVPFGIMVK